MESRLFKALFEDAESENAKAFVRHFGALVSLHEAALNTCLEKIPNFLRLRTPFQTRTMIEELAAGTGAELEVIEHSISVLRFLVKALLSDDLPVADAKYWVNDLVSHPAFSTQGANVDKIVQWLVRNRAELECKDREERASAGVMPRFSRMGVTVEARAIRDGRYRWGTSVDDYSPKVIGVTYLASVHVGLDEGTPQDFYFQMDETDLKNMIGSLISAQKEICALREHLEEKEDGR